MRALAAPDADAAGPRARAPEAPARWSAAERLAADRAKYVRGLAPGGSRARAPEGPAGDRPVPARAPDGPAGDQTVSTRAPEGPAGDRPVPARAPEPVARRVIARRPLRPDSLVMYRQKCEFARGSDADAARVGLVKRLLPGPGRDRVASPAEDAMARAAGRAGAKEAAAPEPRPEASATLAPGAQPAAPPATPAPGLRPAAPTTCTRTAAPPGAPGPDPRPAAPALDQHPAAPGPGPAGSSCAAARGGSELRGARRAGLRRSQSDLSSRFSVSLAELDIFFQFCGLEPDVVEALGRENFSAGSERASRKFRSVSVATSDSGFSRHSGGDEGLQEDELTEQVPSTTSVVERNARIIKWLYTCRKAREAPRLPPQGPA